jgi:hypothetical protein
VKIVKQSDRFFDLAHVIHYRNCFKEGGTCFKYYSIIVASRYALFFSSKKPSAIGALLLAISIFQYPFIVNIIYSALNSTQAGSSVPIIEVNGTILTSTNGDWYLIYLKSAIFK